MIEVEESEGYEEVFTTSTAGMYALALVSSSSNHSFKADSNGLQFTASPVTGCLTVLVFLGSGVVVSHSGDDGELHGGRIAEEL